MWETAMFLAAGFWYPRASVSPEFQAWEPAQSWGTAVSIKSLKIFQCQTKKADSPDLACHHPELEMSYFLGRGTTCPVFKKKKKIEIKTTQTRSMIHYHRYEQQWKLLCREQVFNTALSDPALDRVRQHCVKNTWVQTLLQPALAGNSEVTIC